MLRERFRRLLPMRFSVDAFVRSNCGATAIEYGLIAGIVSIAIVAGATLIGLGLSDILQLLSDTLSAS